MSRPENVDRADQIGVFFETAFDAQKPGLRLAVVRRHMAAGRARPRRVLRRHDDEMPAGPCQLVAQLSAELEPALVEDGFVQTGLGPHVLSRCSVVPAADLVMFRTCKSSIHTIAWFWLIAVEVLCRKSRRALPIRSECADSGFRLLPVVAEFGFAAHGLLRCRAVSCA